MTVAEFLRDTHLSKPEIAKKTRVHLSTVYRWEEGRQNPEGDALIRLVGLSDGKLSLEKLLRQARRGKYPRQRRA